MQVQNIYSGNLCGYKQNTKTNNISSGLNTQLKPMAFGQKGGIPAEQVKRGQEILTEAAKLLALGKKSQRPIEQNGSFFDFTFARDILTGVEKITGEFSEYFSFAGDKLRQFVRMKGKDSEIFDFSNGELIGVSIEELGKPFQMYSA